VKVDKYIVKYVRNTDSKHISTTIEMSRDEAKELYDSNVEYYSKGKLKPYISISLCKVEYTDIMQHNFI
jgi:hypothetical protein